MVGCMMVLFQSSSFVAFQSISFVKERLERLKKTVIIGESWETHFWPSFGAPNFVFWEQCVWLSLKRRYMGASV